MHRFTVSECHYPKRSTVKLGERGPVTYSVIGLNFSAVGSSEHTLAQVITKIRSLSLDGAPSIVVDCFHVANTAERSVTQYARIAASV